MSLLEWTKERGRRSQCDIRKREAEGFLFRACSSLQAHQDLALQFPRCFGNDFLCSLQRAATSPHPTRRFRPQISDSHSVQSLLRQSTRSVKCSMNKLAPLPAMLIVRFSTLQPSVFICVFLRECSICLSMAVGSQPVSLPSLQINCKVAGATFKIQKQCKHFLRDERREGELMVFKGMTSRSSEKYLYREYSR